MYVCMYTNCTLKHLHHSFVHWCQKVQHMSFVEPRTSSFEMCVLTTSYLYIYDINSKNGCVLTTCE